MEGKTLLQILPALNEGGVERGTVDIAECFVKAGGKSLVASSGGRLETNVKRVKAEHIKHDFATKNIFRILLNIGIIKRLVKENDVDIVHVRSRAPAWSAYFACKKMGVPLVTTFHGTYGSGFFLKRWYNSIMLRGKRVIVISEFIKDHVLTKYKGYLKGREKDLSLVHRGVDLNIFSPDQIPTSRLILTIEKYKLEDKVPVILFPARFTEWKGHLTLLRALKEIDKDFLCIFVGGYSNDDPYVIRIQSLIDKYRLKNRVLLAGHISDIGTLYMLSSIVVSASTKPEAFGRVAIEGQAMGKIVIATNHGGSQETVIDGETGFLVKFGDPMDLAHKIDHVLSMTNRKQKMMGTKAIKHVRENFTLKTMCKETLAVYGECLK